MQLHQGTWLEAGVITWTLIVHGVPPTNFRSAKMSTFWRDFWQLSTLSIYNSGKDRHIGNLNSKWSTTIPPTLGVKIWWTLVHKQKRYSRTCWPTQLDFFQGDYILALRGCCPLKFSHAQQYPKLYFRCELGRWVASSWALPHMSSIFYLESSQ